LEQFCGKGGSQGGAAKDLHPLRLPAFAPLRWILHAGRGLAGTRRRGLQRRWTCHFGAQRRRCNHAWIARLETFCGKSSEVTVHEPFTLTLGLFQSNPIKANQGKSRYFKNHESAAGWKKWGDFVLEVGEVLRA
jgi:hypothetical protein